MADLNDLINLSLTFISADTVLDLTEDSEPARIANRIFPAVRDACLRAHPWNSALRRASVAADADPPAFGFAFQYTLPVDPFCLRVWRMVEPEIVYQVEGRKILTDQPAPLQFRFIARVDDIAEWDALLFQVVAVRIAATMAYRVTRSRSKEDRLWQLYTDLVKPEARSVDGQEGTPEEPQQDDFLLSRL